MSHVDFKLHHNQLLCSVKLCASHAKSVVTLGYLASQVVCGVVLLKWILSFFGNEPKFSLFLLRPCLWHLVINTIYHKTQSEPFTSIIFLHNITN